MICKNCGLKDGYSSDMFEPDRKVCDVCGCDKWLDYKRTKVKIGETRKVRVPLIIPPIELISEGQLLKIGSIGAVYTTFEDCEIMINETREDVFNNDNILDETTKRKNIYSGGGSLVKIETKWLYENTEVVNCKN